MNFSIIQVQHPQLRWRHNEEIKMIIYPFGITLFSCPIYYILWFMKEMHLFSERIPVFIKGIH